MAGGLVLLFLPKSYINESKDLSSELRVLLSLDGEGLGSSSLGGCHSRGWELLRASWVI